MSSASSSFDGEYWDSDARYHYGSTGELARRELGEDKLAGLDYTYTAQGGLKGINAPSNVDDPGGDSISNRYGADGLVSFVQN